VLHTDMPLLRRIVRDTAPDNYRFSSVVLAIVKSPAFQYDRVPQDAGAR
jgi:hypothetical protein